MSKPSRLFQQAHDMIVSKQYDKDPSIVAAVESQDNAGLTDMTSALVLAASLDDTSIESYGADSLVISAATKASAAIQSDRSKLFQPVSSNYGISYGNSFNASSDEVTSLEHFDGREVSTYQAATFAYNVSAATQDPFSEAFFPTVIGDISTAGISVELRTTQVINSFLRTNTSPDSKKSNRKSLITSISDPNGILASDQLKLIPVVGGNFDSILNLPLTKSKFYDASNETVQTAPYKLNTTLNVIGAAQSSTLIASGVMDNTDTLDASVPVEALYFSTATANTFVRIDTTHLDGAVFLAGVRGDSKDLVLNTKTTLVVTLTDLVDYVTGTAITPIAALPAGSKAVFDIELYGTGNAVDGELSVVVGKWEFVGARDINGNAITAGATYTAIQTQATALTAVGVDLNTRITNSNLRRHGIKLTSKPTTEKLPIRAKTPIFTDAPIIGQNVGKHDGAFITDLVSVTGILSSLSAVSTIIGFADFMAAQAGLNPDEINTNAIGQVACRPFYKHTAMVLTDYVDSNRGQDRAADIRATVLNNIATDVSLMLTESGYSDYENFVKRAGKIDIVIGTYPALAAYLGDEIDLGNGCRAKVVTSNNRNMNNRMFVTIGDSNANQTKISVDRFGSRLFVPSLVSTAVVTENGKPTNKTVVNPLFEHVVTLPVLLDYTVTGLETVLAKVTTNRRTVV